MLVCNQNNWNFWLKYCYIIIIYFGKICVHLRKNNLYEQFGHLVIQSNLDKSMLPLETQNLLWHYLKVIWNLLEVQVGSLSMVQLLCILANYLLNYKLKECISLKFQINMKGQINWQGAQKNLILLCYEQLCVLFQNKNNWAYLFC